MTQIRYMFAMMLIPLVTALLCWAVWIYLQ